MATGREYMEFIREQLLPADGISFKAMMGEYIIYCRGIIIGGIYDDRFLVKETKASKALLPGAPLEEPYEGAKKMLLVEEVDDKTFLKELVCAVADELAQKNAGRMSRKDK